MALAPCRECGAQISDQAPACPHCGVPRAAPQIAPVMHPSSRPSYGVQAVGALVAVTGGPAGCIAFDSAGAGVVATLVGFLIFGFGRFMASQGQ